MLCLYSHALHRRSLQFYLRQRCVVGCRCPLADATCSNCAGWCPFAHVLAATDNYIWSCKQGLEALQPRLQAWLGRMGSAADALLAAAQPAGAGSWDLENKVGLAVAFGQAPDKAPVVWLDLLFPQARPCPRLHMSDLVAP